MVGLSTEIQNAILDELIGVGGKLEDATVELFTNSPDFSTLLTAASFTAPTFTGYAAQTPTWTTFTGPNGTRYAASEPLVFNPTDAVGLPQIVNGYWVREVTSGDYLAGGYFANPLTVSFADQAFHCVAVVPIDRLQLTISGEGAII